MRFKYQFVCCALFLIAGASAADAAPPAPAAPAPARGEGAGKGLRRACMRQAGDVFTAVDKALTDVREAWKLDDPVKLKEALAQAEGALQKAHDHMSACSPAVRGGIGMKHRAMRRGMPDDG